MPGTWIGGWGGDPPRDLTTNRTMIIRRITPPTLMMIMGSISVAPALSASEARADVLSPELFDTSEAGTLGAARFRVRFVESDAPEPDV